MLTFNFVSRTLAYKSLARGLSSAPSAFSSFMREYLDRVIKAGQCAQYVDDIGIAANTLTQLIQNICAVFECIRQAGLKLAIRNATLKSEKENFLQEGAAQGAAPEDQKFF